VRRYDAPTPFVWVIGRTQASVETYDEVHAFQSGMKLAPLSSWGEEPSPVRGSVDPEVDAKTPPLRQVFAMSPETFFAYGAELLKQYPPQHVDYPVLDRLAHIGFVAGESFDLTSSADEVKSALSKAVTDAQKLITEQEMKVGRHVNGWGVITSTIGTYGTDYLQRATIALAGLGANLAADAIYPVVFADADGKPFDGTSRYVWHLTAEEVPPVNAFWSLTLYDSEGFQVANELNRYAIGDRDALEFGPDGSLDIFIQHEKPESGSSNWLPAPEGGFNLCARLYYPKPQVLDGSWVPPVVTRTA
jgi:hypothetical protein